MHIFNENDLREANKKQINLDSFLEEAKKNKDLEEEFVDENKIDEDETPNKIIENLEEIEKELESNKNKLKEIIYK